MGNVNTYLTKARYNKKDEFFTLLKDIQNELQYYTKYFHNKVVYCNCDNPKNSEFWNYFHTNFNALNLKGLISTHFNIDGTPAYKMEYSGGNDDDITVGVKTPLQNGSFDSQECIAELQKADIVVTNPAFSLFRQFIALLTEYDKKFIVIGNQNAITYKEVFSLIKDNKLWLGHGFKGTVGFFKSPYEDNAVANQHQDGLIRVSGVVWFTNLDIPKRHIQLDLKKSYNAIDYPFYDNCNTVINVDRTMDIPNDYDGIMGVPISWINKYNPAQFQILGMDKDFTVDKKRGCINGKYKYARIFIKRV